MSDLAEVSVIVPTRALAARASLIHRALESVLSQERVRALPILVVNGPDRDSSLVGELNRDPRLQVIDLEAAGIPGALRAGREAVETEWFASIDDDDVYLPGALAARVEALKARPAFDTVVTNGLRRGGYGDRLHVPDMSSVECAPLDALNRGNWLLPGAWLCHTARVGASLFEGMPNMLECTYLAIQFTLRCNTCFLDRPTVVWYVDSPASESMSRAYILGGVAAHERLLELPLPTETRRWMRERLTSAMHGVSDLHYRERALSKAWQWHVRTLVRPGGWRYLPFSLRLLLAAARR